MIISNIRKPRLGHRLSWGLLSCMAVSVVLASTILLPRSSAADAVLVNLTASPTSPRPGDIVSFTISYSNPSASPVHNVTVFERLPLELVFISSKPFYDGVSLPETGFLS